MQLPLAVLLVMQGAGASPPAALRVDRAELRAGLDTLYAGAFPVAAQYFTELSARDSADPAPVIFHAGALIWWAAAQNSDDFASAAIDSLLGRAITLARASPPGADHDFWLGTAIGYRARERELHGHAWSAARDAKAMRDAYARVLAADSSCSDCWLGLGLYSYGLARASAIARFVAKLIGLGSGNAAEGIAMLRRAATAGDLARIEATWVLASALRREAARDPGRRAELRGDAVALVDALAQRFPANPVFQHFLREMSDSSP
ncbi:MAG TPA: hypothetical protein VKB45_08640 [Gemmatimonadales bacterium]|nr:hypothetical protein [Gemmatimonadales bacterium]